MQTVREIQRRAARDLRRRIFESGVFRRQHMKDMAGALARKHTAGMSPDKLLALARHDTWLKRRKSRSARSPYPGEKTGRIAEELLGYLRSELRILVDTFWDGRTSVELAVQDSSAELAGFFNGERPTRRVPAKGPHDDAHSFPHASYV